MHPSLHQVMKQSKLSFASKRTASAAALGKESKSKATRKQPTRASSSPETLIVISESSDDEHEVPAPKKRRLVPSNDKDLTKQSPQKYAEEGAKVAPEPEREPLNISDKRWRMLYGEVRDKMGNIEPGE